MRHPHPQHGDAWLTARPRPPASPGPDPDSGNPLPGLGWGVLGGLGLWTLLVRSALALWYKLYL
jgi:hypothetical protein